MAEVIQVQVCYATAQAQFLREVLVPQGTTLQQAVTQSGILQAFPEIDLQRNRVGIYSKVKTLDAIVHEHDRIEIYHALIADPKETRRKRVVKARP